MLSEAEKKGCLNILKLISRSDVVALANTITNRHIALESLEDAENAILAFSVTAQEFLRRQKITKSLLIQYLYNEAVPCRPDIGKTEIIDVITKYWASCQDKGLDPRQTPNQELLSGQSSAQASLQQAGHLPGSPVLIQNNYINNYNVSCTVDFSGVSAHAEEQKKAEAFVNWFYDMLNSHNPVLKRSPQNFGPQHFWENARLALSMVSSLSTEQNEILDGSSSVAVKLLSFPKTNYLIFNPNLSCDGVAIKSHPHGPRMILVCGMLHKDNDIVGMFQQSFGLVRDPLAPKFWKIKVTCLKMKEGSTTRMLRLTDSSEISAIEQYTVTTLQETS